MYKHHQNLPALIVAFNIKCFSSLAATSITDHILVVFLLTNSVTVTNVLMVLCCYFSMEVETNLKLGRPVQHSAETVACVFLFPRLLRCHHVVFDNESFD